MRPATRTVGVFVAWALALTLFAGVVSAGMAPAATPVPGANALKSRYKLPPQALAGLPTGIILQRLAQRLPAGVAPRGLQYFQSPAGLSGMFFQQGPPPAGNLLLFPVQGEWVFLPDQRFQQADPRGNRLVLGNGKAQVLDSAGLQIGAFQDPALGALYGALLKLTM